ncbi:hypothetical protein HA402_001386 [Bradysia odoriphaga]|nr:hypothetical protein HA402_001386 [Bradysia odoriphaga]
MQNIYDIGREPYVPAEPIKNRTFFECFCFVFVLFVDIIKVFLLSIPHLFIALHKVVVKPAKKSVFGQTVLVTGGGNGIGKEIAIQFAANGCNIAIADMDIKAAEQTAMQLNKMNVVARAYHVDITSTDQIQKLKTDIEKDMAPVDILINNAAIVPLLSLREDTDDDVERIINVNITAQIHVTRTFLPDMIKRKRGHIVGIASLSAVHPTGGAVIYSATKGAMQNFIVALNEELRQEGNDCIKCTSILPFMAATRKDIIDAAHVRLPIISPTYVARVAVNAILRDQLMVSAPRSYLWLIQWMNLLPFSVQMLVRDIVMKEKGRKLLSEDNKRK